MSLQLNIFTIYTSEDKEILLHLLGHLKSFGEDLNLSIWHDDPIHSGQEWKPQIASRLDRADIFLLFVSNAFMHSQFIQQLEFKMVIDRYKEGTATVIPIILENCPWDIDFTSEEYNFNFKELQVLPKEGKPIKEWDSSEQAYTNVAASIKAVVTSFVANDVLEESKKDKEEKAETAKAEAQIAISFNEEREAEEKRRIKKVEENRVAEEENKRKEETEAKNRAAEEKRRKEEVEAKRRTKEQRLKDEAEIKKIGEEKRLKEEAEVKRRTEQERRLAEENRQEFPAELSKEVEETQLLKGSDLKKRILLGSLVAVLALIVIWALSVFNTGSEKQSKPSPISKVTEVEDSIPLEKTEIDPITTKEPLPEMAVGDTYNGGIIFSIDSDRKTGKIVHLEDAGPMTWKNAILIHEQLGDGWRLPTFDELQLLYNTVGQGAKNTAEFADGLYWSATDYDQYQARLLRFRDGNRSYHYNKEADHRKFHLRAVRDFSR